MSSIRMFHIEFAKFIAILMVTGFHIWRFIGSPSQVLYGFDLWGFWKNGYMGCDLFFLVSGYLSMLSWEKNAKLSFKDSLKKYYKSKIIRIIPVYYIAIAIWYVFVQLGIEVRSYGVIDILTHMFFVHTFKGSTFFSTSGVFWYLAVQVHFYLIFPFIVKIFKKYNRRILFGLSFLPLVLVNILMMMGRTEDYVLYWNAATFMPSFLCGILLYKRDFIFKNTLCLVPIIIACIAIIFVGKITVLVGAFDRVLVGITLGISFMNLSLLFDKLASTMKNIVSLISAASFSIYLYNYIFAAWSPSLQLGPGLVLYVMLVFGFGILMYYIIEKPLSDLLRKLK